MLPFGSAFRQLFQLALPCPLHFITLIIILRLQAGYIHYIPLHSLFYLLVTVGDRRSKIMELHKNDR